jgi:predicted DNA-binding transcriptional regulator AlpA
MTHPAPILASETSAARLLDMKPAEFRELVKAGHLPRGREIAPGLVRWSVDDLRRIVSGEAVEGMGDIQW